jgi:NodT family efflux transporter outer membrane factor (OMF) lipoprotein
MSRIRANPTLGVGAIAASLLLGACAVGPEFARPAPPNVDRYTSRPLPAATVAADGQAQRFLPGTAVAADWWRLFQSEPLDAIVRQALAHNPTVQASEASLRQSQDRLRAGQGVFYPQAAAGLDARRERTASTQPGVQGSGGIFNLVTLSGTVGYVLDVFGGERRAVESLRAQVDSQYFESKAAYLLLSASVVDASIARAGYAAQVRATGQLIELETQQLHAIEAQVLAGTAPYSSALSMRSLIAANRASLAPLEQRLSETGHLLAALEGVTPAEATPPDLDLATLALPADLPLGVPSDLVRQRPDILAAEAQLRVACANIGVATAAMLPSFRLTGTYGAAGSDLAGLSSSGGRFWSFGPSATVPLFQGGSLWYGRKAAVDAYEQAQASYRETVLAAFVQVADSLKALEHDAEALQAQDEAQRDAAEALRLLQANHQAGLVAYIDVLAADVQLHATAIARVQAVAQRHQDTVALFVALGGGWWNAPPVAGGRSP